MSPPSDWTAPQRRWAGWPILALPALMAILHASVGPAVFYDPEWLILLGNTLFVGVVSFIVAGIAWRNYVSTGRVQVLLLGCGMLVFGLGGVLAAGIRGLPGGANLNVTVYNTSALLGALLHVTAALMLAGDLAPETGGRSRLGWLCLGYGASVLAIGALTLASLKGAVPVFFIQGVGPTPLRQQVLSAAIILFLFSSLVFLATYRRNGEPFLFWYAGGLALTAISLGGFFIQNSVGSPVGWTGRAAQYLGGVYFLAALLSAERQARLKGTAQEGALSASLVGAEERFRSAFANAAVGFTMATLSRRLVNANPAYCHLTGYSLEELRALDYPGLIHPDDQAADQARFRRMVAGEFADYTLEHRYVRKDGRVVWVRKTVSLVRDVRDAPVWIVAFLEDITERKQSESALREANRQKDEFLATLAHELRNPLAPIRTAAHILAARGSGDPQLKALHDLIGRQAAHMARLVDDLLDVSRIERGKLTLKKERVDFGAAVARALEASRHHLAQRGHQLSVDLPAAPVELDADPGRVDQMICNLVHNACKFTPPGGRIWVSARSEGPEAVLRVRDDGAGMTNGTIGHVFDLFYQAGQSLDRPEGGLGIGLTLVDRLARLHQGSVSAASPGLGQGSEFTLRLPVMESARPVPGPQGGLHQAVLRTNAERPRQVLVVDDNEGMVLTTRLLLESLGFRVSSAGTGEEGLRKILAQPPDIALVDLGLPGLDGYAVARRVRAELGRRVRLVALTGYSRDADVASAMAAGFDRHLVKAADPDELIAALQAFLY
jgi:two-component system CheB/CheR fusion protein